MRRIVTEPRPDWPQRVERLGLLFHHNEDQTAYWRETAYYAFSEAEIDTLETATNELHARCLEVVEHVISHERFAEIHIPDWAVPGIRASWEAEAPSLYGRFDLSYSGEGSMPKLLEYNADTPTSLLEAGVVQWHWLTDKFPEADQFNSIWEGLVETWTAMRESGFLDDRPVHFASVESLEDEMTVQMLRDTAAEAGLGSIFLNMTEIGWDRFLQQFVDLNERPIHTLFKLYPWEWMYRDGFGRDALSPKVKTRWLEPAWKAILSNKAILPILWERFPDHPNLLPAYADGPRDLAAWVRKPCFGREGANVTIESPGESYATAGEYNDAAFVWQGYAPLPEFDGQRPVLGTWVIGGEARGMGIRETHGPVTHNLSHFVPHLFWPA